ncbi:hypothetical protein J3B02_004845, partial [Coemansia erecta]
QQAQRDEKMRSEQAQRDEKMRSEQAQRDERIFSLFEQQAQRDERARAEQAQRDENIFGVLQKQSTVLENLQQMVGNPGWHSGHNARVASGFDMPIPRSSGLMRNSMPQIRGSQMQTKSQAASHSGTPQVTGQKMDQFTKEEYIALSQSYAGICKSCTLDEALEMLGDDWRAAWNSFCNDMELAGPQTLRIILNECHSKCPSAWTQLENSSVSEQTYQTTFRALCEAIQSHADRLQSTAHGVNWRDTHSTSIKRADGRNRKPDGCFAIKSSTRLCWQDIVVVAEIKGSVVDNDNDVIRGQLLQDFIDMAEVLPRRFMIGFTLARGGEVRLYVCVPGGIYIAPLGKMPSTCMARAKEAHIAEPLGSEQTIVHFLLFMHQQLAKDCGYLTAHSTGFPCSFQLGDIVGSSQNKQSVLSSATSIRLNSSSLTTGEVLGRHGYLRGQRTWVYPAEYMRIMGSRYINAFFKFQWAFDSDLEIDVHQFVLNRGVPHVPKLLYMANIEGKGAAGTHSQRFKGEIIVMEDVGVSVQSAFDKYGLNMSDAAIIDLFAGYAHTLLAAAAIDENDK